MSKIYIDIETIPSQEKWVKESITVKHPATIKKQETIDKWYKEKHDEAYNSAYEKTVFDGTTNHIICASVAIDDQEPYTTPCITDTDEETGILDCIDDYLSTWCDDYGNMTIGHNIIGFDLSVIKKRMIILGFEPKFKFPFNAKPWSDDVYDTMLKWDSKNFTSQDKICQALGIDGKGDIDGSMVYQYWKDGRFEEISAYCQNDVETVRKIHKRMRLVC